MTALIRHRLSPVLALALLATLLVASSSGQAAESSYDNVERIDVSNYTAAGIAVSKRVFPDGADAAVLTRDDHFPDALAASALAAKVNGPVLFTATASLTSSTATELDRILDAGDTVYITGGDAAVSEDVANQIRARGYAVQRLNGATRIETAVDIAEFVEAPSSGHVLLARAYGPDGADRVTGWVDSVTCGGYANHAQTPVLLTQTASLDQATATALDTLNAEKVTICGGDAAVSGNVAQQLRDAGLTVERVSGATRIETAIDAAKKLFGATSAAGRNYVLVTGYGENFGWGLAATPLAGALDAPILLVAPDQPTSCTDESQSARQTLCYLETVGSGKADLVVVGGTPQVGDAVRDAAAKAAGGQEAAGTDGGNTDGTDGTSTNEALATPTSVTTSNVSTPSEGRVTVSWAAVSDPDDRLKGYNVYYGQTSPDIKAGSSTPTVGPDATSFTVGALQLDTTYTFAVTSVTTDGQESPKSSTVSETTAAPSVDLTTPTAASPLATEPATGFTATFDYAASEGGTFQVFHRVSGDDAWSPFPETPNTGKPTLAAHDGTTRSVNLTAPSPSDATTYDLRVVVTPSGAEPVEDVEIGALEIVDPAIELTTPSHGDPVQTLPGPGAEFDLVFAYDTPEGASYTLSLKRRDADADPQPTWEDVASGEAPAGSHTVTETVTAPEQEGVYDVRATLDTGDGTPDAFVVEEGLYVVQPTITLDGPTEASPVLASPGDTIEVVFSTTAGGDYTVLHDAGDTGDWVPFQDGTGRVTTPDGGSGFRHAVTLPADLAVDDYGIRVSLDPDADQGTPRTDDQPSVLAVATVTMTQPASGDGQHTVDRDRNGDPFDVTFTFASPRDLEYQLSYVPDDGTGWEDFLAAPEALSAADPGEETANDVAAPAADDQQVTYDLRVQLSLPGGAGTVENIQDRALVVEAGGDSVTLQSPNQGAPAQTSSHADGVRTFDATIHSDVADTAVIEYATAGSGATCDGGTWETLGETPIAADETKTVQDLAAPQPQEQHADNTYDLRVRLETAGLCHHQAGALRVASVEIDTVSPDPVGPGEDLTVTFLTNVTGDYALEHSQNGTDWTAFSIDDTTAAPSDETVTVDAPPDPAEYYLRVRLELEGSGLDDAQHEEQGAFTVSNDADPATVTLTYPTETTPAATTSGGPFPVAFEASDAGAYRLTYSSDDGTTWTDPECGTATSDTPNQHQATAPGTDGTYHVRVELYVGASDCTGTASAETIEENALTVGADISTGEDVAVALTGPPCQQYNGTSELYELTVENLTATPTDPLRAEFIFALSGTLVNDESLSVEHRASDSQNYVEMVLTPDPAATATWSGTLPSTGGFAVEAGTPTRFQLKVAHSNPNAMSGFTVMEVEVQLKDSADNIVGAPPEPTSVQIINPCPVP